MRRAAAALLLAVAPAEAFEMILPADCRLGETCFFQQYVDHDTGPGAHDLRCGARSYDGHDGTDIALPDLAAMERGVDVLAPADGVVLGVRDGMVDHRGTSAQRASIPSDRACGNGVLIDHGAGWTTQSCHFRQGSVTVRPGDRVISGDPIGQIGFSGWTEFPHLHISVRHNGAIKDPFNGLSPENTCEGARVDLWRDDAAVAYDAGGALGTGILTVVPTYESVKADRPHQSQLTAESDAIVVWAHFYGLELGDVIEMRLTGPDGTVLAEQSYEMPKNRAREMRVVGRKARGLWPKGSYTGVSILIRQGDVVNRSEVSANVQ
ncbi:MAG: M23 family metallopeptidase [Pseudomonadota bacterium]